MTLESVKSFLKRQVLYQCLDFNFLYNYVCQDKHTRHGYVKHIIKLMSISWMGIFGNELISIDIPK